AALQQCLVPEHHADRVNLDPGRLDIVADEIGACVDLRGVGRPAVLGVQTVGEEDDVFADGGRGRGRLGQGFVGRERVPAPDQADGEVGLAARHHLVDLGVERGPVAGQRLNGGERAVHRRIPRRLVGGGGGVLHIVGLDVVDDAAGPGGYGAVLLLLVPAALVAAAAAAVHVAPIDPWLVLVGRSDIDLGRERDDGDL